jgi:hypothetical protein
MFDHPNDPDVDQTEWETYVYEYDLHEMFEAHLRPPEDDDFEEVLR